MEQALLGAAAGTLFSFAMTVLGSAMVFLFRKLPTDKWYRLLLGFAAGVMMAASVWSLLIPSIEYTKNLPLPNWLPAVGGVLSGVIFLIFADIVIEKSRLLTTILHRHLPYQKSSVWMMMAVTLHNIPEGLAIGLSFAMAVKTGQIDSGMYAAAIALALGIGVQNFPEGAAISLPLHQDGISAVRSFVYGSLSAIVEPIFGIVTVCLVSYVQIVLPWLLAFAAGAMLYVVIHELLPAPKQQGSSVGFTLSVIVGFLTMMLLDVALG